MTKPGGTTPTATQRYILGNLAAGRVPWYGLRRGGGFDTSMAALRRFGWVTGHGYGAKLTDDGLALVAK